MYVEQYPESINREEDGSIELLFDYWFMHGLEAVLVLFVIIVSLVVPLSRFFYQ